MILIITYSSYLSKQNKHYTNCLGKELFNTLLNLFYLIAIHIVFSPKSSHNNNI